MNEPMCVCGHARDEHHDMVAECEFFGSNEEGGADEHGWPHCGAFVPIDAPLERIESWRMSEIRSWYRAALERLTAAVQAELAQAPPATVGRLKAVLEDIDAASRRRITLREIDAARRQWQKTR